MRYVERGDGPEIPGSLARRILETAGWNPHSAPPAWQDPQLAAPIQGNLSHAYHRPYPIIYFSSSISTRMHSCLDMIHPPKDRVD